MERGRKSYGPTPLAHHTDAHTLRHTGTQASIPWQTSLNDIDNGSSVRAAGTSTWDSAGYVVSALSISVK